MLIVALSQAPNLGVAIAITAVAFFVAGMYIPPFTTVQALVAPARVRTLSFAFGSLFLVAGVLILYLIIPVAGLSDTHGIRVGMAALGPYWLIAGIPFSLWHIGFNVALFVTTQAALLAITETLALFSALY